MSGLLFNLKQPPAIFNNCGSKPVYIQSNDEEYIIITLYGKGVYKYVLSSDQFLFHSAYPSNVTALYHGHAVDAKNNQLYIFGGDHRIFATLNMTDDIWNVHCANYQKGFMSSFKHKTHKKYGLDSLLIDRPESIFVPSPINELHIFINKENKKQHDSVFHIKYDTKKQQFIKLHEFPHFHLFAGSPILYDETRQRIILFGGSDTITCKSQIWFCNLYASQTKYEWQLFPTVLPRQSNYFDIILGFFDRIAIVVYFSSYDNYDIWCYDIVDNKWYKSSIKYPKHKPKTFVIGTENGWVHYMNFENTRAKGHFKTRLLPLLPAKLRKKLTKQFEYLVHGYCNRISNSIVNIIPSDVIQMIFAFHPLFNDIYVQ